MSNTHQLLNYSKLEDIAKDNTEFLLDVTQSYIDLIGQFKKDYQIACMGSDTKFFQEVTHKMKGSLRFMETHKLLYAVAEFREVFYEGTHTPEAVQGSIKHVNEICDQILAILEEKKSGIA